MSVHVCRLSLPLSPTHDNKYETYSSSVFDLRGPENINAVCLINFCHCPGKFVSSFRIDGGVIPANSIVIFCAYEF